jgi:hypothetical protein
MEQHNHDFRNKHLAAVWAKLGESLSARHDLMGPLAPRFVELLQQLDASALDRETARARLYADSRGGCRGDGPLGAQKTGRIGT